MKIPKDSSLAALIAFFGGVYPILLLGQAVEWPRAVQTVLGCVGLVVFTGVKVGVMAHNRRRARLTYPRRADGRPQRTWRGRPGRG
ncbi:hypothetical protein VSS74_27635 [Conexibacter stalactiti]|uniref:Uncharacterized protein n=1 Tax=Conexibacter stalactiti TaxID=1940611 RepID=A0ABU4I071_9ACTN|nr:hypothetical protein [Conexibacter stalactiti]MDW5598160.1 hypothetical protein [Conexibacter stalactiti]MEC5038802.1 hypothetical protein [Conexibacter stalactiti]